LGIKTFMPPVVGETPLDYVLREKTEMCSDEYRPWTELGNTRAQAVVRGKQRRKKETLGHRTKWRPIRASISVNVPRRNR